MNALREKYPQEVQAILAKYPPDQKRAAVMPLLYLAQCELNFVTRQSLADIGEILGISPTDVASIVGFYSLYYDEPGGKYRLQVCTDLPCALRGADQFLEQLCENVGLRVGETSPDGLYVIEEVKCLAACHRAPMFQVQSGEGLTYHENQTVETALELINGWKQQAATEAAPPPAAEEEGVRPKAEGGTTRLTQEERVKIMEQGGQ